MQIATAKSPGRQLTNIFWKPVGYPRNRELTVPNIEKWVENEHPGFLRRSNPLTLAGVVSSVVGLITSFFSIGNEKPVYPGLLLMLVGIGSALFGLMGRANNKEINSSVETLQYNPNSIELESNNMRKV